MDINDISKFKQLFINEATTLLNSMEGIILDLEKNPDNMDLIQEVFRVMHTIKGVSGMYGFDTMNELTHSIENIYDLLRNGALQVNKDILDLTLKTVDQLFALIEDKDMKNVNTANNQISLLKQSENIISASSAAGDFKAITTKDGSAPVATYNIILHTPQSILDRKINIFYAIKDLSEIGEIRSINPLPSESDDDERWSIFIVGEIDDELMEDALMFVYEYCIIRKVADYDVFNDEQLDSVKEKLSESEEDSQVHVDETDIIINEESSNNSISKSQNAIDSIRQNMNRVYVDSDKLDHLMFLVSELITTSSQLNLMTSDKIFNPIRSQIEKLDKLSTNFRNNALEVRLIPIRDITPKFNRLVRDISNDLGKDVDFITEGMETELDKSTIDMIAEPLVHMLRNALDHGIETPEERQEKGKQAKGTIKLKAYNSGSNILIEVSDDGQGLDKNKLLKKAIDKGIIASSDKLSDNEIYDLICHPGFSTASEVTSISGRGVGMDVVRQKVAEMRGSLEISSQLEKGSTFTIILQQSISIMDTLLIKSDTMNCLVPLNEIELCSQISYDELQTRLKHGTISFEQSLIPFISLRHHFGLLNNEPNNYKTLILNRNGARIAILTDEIIGQHQAVLKPMGNLVRDHDEFTAASVLGNGEIAFLIDTSIFNYHTCD